MAAVACSSLDCTARASEQVAREVAEARGEVELWLCARHAREDRRRVEHAGAAARGWLRRARDVVFS